MKWLAPAAVVTLALLGEFVLGRLLAGAPIAFFVGRFHPLAVHLPIGFFLLVVLGELASFEPRLRSRVEPTLGLLLPVSAAAAVAAFLMGQLLALEGGFPAGSLTWHRRLTLIAVIGIAVCWVAFDWQARRGRSARWVYRAILGGTLAVLSLGAHFGGSMTRGDTYLTQYAPAFMQRMLGTARAERPAHEAPKAEAVAEPLLFQDVVLPILSERCVKCHGAEKQKGKLRLDSFEQLAKGGENGAVIKAGLPVQSPLVQRTSLPIDDDDRMPPDGKPTFLPEERALIEFWIERGALDTLKVRDALSPLASRALLERSLLGQGVALAPAAALAASSASGVGSSTAAPRAAGSGSSKATPSEVVAGPGPPSTAATPAALAARDAAPASAAAVTAGAVATSGPGVLATHCVKCHGPQKQKGKLRVDSVASLLAGGSDGPALVPGEPEKSSIITRLHLPLSSDDHMPPSKEMQLTSAEISLLTRWVKGGAGANRTSAAADSDRQAASAAAPANSNSVPPSSAASADDSKSPRAPSSSEALASRADANLAASTIGARLYSDAVEPLLRDKCGKCHIRERPSGDLSLAGYADLLQGGFSGPAIVPKSRAKSPLFTRAKLPLDDEEHMPPEGEPQLSNEQIELIGAWIDQGALANPSQAALTPNGSGAPIPADRDRTRAQVPIVRGGGCGACGIPRSAQAPWFQPEALSLLAFACWRFRRRRRLDATR